MVATTSSTVPVAYSLFRGGSTEDTGNMPKKGSFTAMSSVIECTHPSSFPLFSLVLLPNIWLLEALTAETSIAVFFRNMRNISSDSSFTSTAINFEVFLSSGGIDRGATHISHISALTGTSMLQARNTFEDADGLDSLLTTPNANYLLDSRLPLHSPASLWDAFNDLSIKHGQHFLTLNYWDDCATRDPVVLKQQDEEVSQDWRVGHPFVAEIENEVQLEVENKVQLEVENDDSDTRGEAPTGEEPISSVRYSWGSFKKIVILTLFLLLVLGMYRNYDLLSKCVEWTDRKTGFFNEVQVVHPPEFRTLSTPIIDRSPSTSYLFGKMYELGSLVELYLNQEITFPQ